MVVNRARHEPLAPSGGFKQSGIARRYGLFGLEAFLEPKAVTTWWRIGGTRLKQAHHEFRNRTRTFPTALPLLELVRFGHSIEGICRRDPRSICAFSCFSPVVNR